MDREPIADRRACRPPLRSMSGGSTASTSSRSRHACSAIPPTPRTSSRRPSTGSRASELDEIDDVRGWLAVVVRRLCLDRIRSAHSRHESVAGVRLPDGSATLQGDRRRRSGRPGHARRSGPARARGRPRPAHARGANRVRAARRVRLPVRRGRRDRRSDAHRVPAARRHPRAALRATRRSGPQAEPREDVAGARRAVHRRVQGRRHLASWSRRSIPTSTARQRCSVSARSFAPKAGPRSRSDCSACSVRAPAPCSFP